MLDPAGGSTEFKGSHLVPDAKCWGPTAFPSKEPCSWEKASLGGAPSDGPSTSQGPVPTGVMQMFLHVGNQP